MNKNGLMNNMISDFPEVKDVAPDKIKELEEDILLLYSRYLKARIRIIDYGDRWFWKIWLNTFYKPEIKDKQRELKRWKRYISPVKREIDDLDIQQAREVELKEVIDIPLKKKGSNYVGLCPFHNEKTPSFFVKGNRYKCFGCGESGNTLDYFIKVNGFTFLEAVKKLIS